MVTAPEPDQIPENWNDVVAAYETVFEPFTLALTQPMIAALKPAPGRTILDVGAGPGAASLSLAGLGARVTAIDSSPAMVRRIAERAVSTRCDIDARIMDAAQLAYPDATFDAALSAFGIVLLADAAGALAEMRRVVKPGGSIAVVTWTEPQNYELASMLMAAADVVYPDRPRGPLPAQLRFREPHDFRALLRSAGLTVGELMRVEALLKAPSPRWLIDRLAFAPGMAAMLATFGHRRADVLAAFEQALDRRFGDGLVRLRGVAHAAVAAVPAE